MPQISNREFEQVPLRVHEFLAGVPLHDAWVVDLPGTLAGKPRPGITLDEFLGAAKAPRDALSPAAKLLLNVRLFVGGLLGLDHEPAANAWEPFATRLTPADRAKSLVPPGTRTGSFRLVYRFANEELRELINRTAHAAAVSALVDLGDSYRFYFGVYVQNVGRITPLYMSVIDPFRKLIVYPSLLRGIRANWNGVLGARSL